MERRGGDRRKPSWPAASRLGLFDGLPAPDLGRRVGICELRKGEALTDAAAKRGGDRFELLEPGLATGRLAHLLLEPAVTQFPLAASLIEGDRDAGETSGLARGVVPRMAGACRPLAIPGAQ